MRRRAWLAALPAVALVRRDASGSGADVVVFAAASLADALGEIGATFERRTGRHVVFSFGPSNDLARQIRAGAPAQVFVSADLEQMNALRAAGLVRPQDGIVLLCNRLAVIVPISSSRAIRTAADLVSVRTLALADPQAVPAGVYARQWLERAGLWAALRGRVIPALDVRAALAAVESEAVDAGVVYRTDAAISRRVRVAFEVPASEAPRIEYPAAPIGDPQPAARAFFDELRSPRARAVFTRFGFETPPSR